MVLRAVFYEQSDAEAVAARLRSDGFAADMVRERLAGEDDDEDHPWAVLTDAPEFVVELLVEQYDGWLDVEHSADEPVRAERPVDQPRPDGTASGVPPLDLPQAPRRIKNHFPRD